MEVARCARGAQWSQRPAVRQRAVHVPLRSRTKGTKAPASRHLSRHQGALGNAEMPGRCSASQSSADSTSPNNSGAMAEEMRNLPADQVADTLWAYVMTHGYDPATCATVAAVATEDITRFGPASLTAILSAFAHVGHVDREFVVTASASMAAPYALAEVDTGTLTQMAWVVAMLSSQGVIKFEQEMEVQDLVLAVLRQAQRKASDFSPDDLARLFAALAELNAPPPTALVDNVSARLLSTLIPLAQLTPTSLAQVVWAYARLGLYNRQVFDAAQTELQRKVGELEWQGLSHAVWAYSTMRDKDTKHRSVYDVNMLATLASRATRLLQAAVQARTPTTPTTPTTTSTPPSISSSTSSSASATDLSPSTEFAAIKAAQGNGHSNSNGNGTHPANGADSGASPSLDEPSCATPPPPPEVQHASLMTMLLSFANVSHHDTPLFDWAGKWLAARTDDCTAQDLVVMAYSYARVKHGVPELMLALSSTVPKVIDQFDGDDLVYLATLGPSTSLYSAGLAKAVFQRALDMCDKSSTALEPAVLLDLARCCAAVIRYEPDYYETVQRKLLRAVHQAQVSIEMDDMSTHCGSTNPMGLQK